MRDPLAPKARSALQVRLERQAQSGRKVFRVSGVTRETRGTSDLPGLKGRWDHLGLKAQLGLPVRKVQKARKGKRVIRATLALRVPRAR
jgi:hypothetical protein